MYIIKNKYILSVSFEIDPVISCCQLNFARHSINIELKDISYYVFS